MKKFLSLVLALVMTMSLVTVSAGAADFSDADDIKYVEAVDVLNYLGIIAGNPDGSFDPDGVLTRAQAAKIISYLRLTPKTAAALAADGAPFADVPADHWAAAYIADGVAEGILAGVGNGNFDPNGKLTGYAYLKMLLVALGANPVTEGFTSANWKRNVVELAENENLDLTAGVEDFAPAAEVTREVAAQLTLNALMAKTMNYGTNNGTTITVGEIVIETAAGSREFGGTFKSTNYASLKDTTTTDDYGRPAVKWTYKNKTIGLYAETPVLVITEATKLADVEDALEELGYDEDAVDVKLAATKNGVVVEYYASDVEDQYGDVTSVVDEIVEIKTALSTVKVLGKDKKATDDDDRYIEINGYGLLVADEDAECWENKTGKMIEVSNFEDLYDEVEKGDKVLVALDKKGEMIAVAIPEVVEGEVTRVNKKDGKVYVDGEVYELVDGAKLPEGFKVKADVEMLLDAYGFVVECEVKTGSGDLSEVVYLTAQFEETDKWGDSTYYAQVVTLEGEVEEWLLEKKMTVEKGLYTYEINDDDEYTLTKATKDVVALAKKSEIKDSSYIYIDGTKYRYCDEIMMVYVDGAKDKLEVEVVEELEAVEEVPANSFAVLDDGKICVYFIGDEAVAADVDGDELIYVADATLVAEEADGYVYEVYMDGVEEEILATNKELKADSFYKYSVDEDGVYTLKTKDVKYAEVVGTWKDTLTIKGQTDVDFELADDAIVLDLTDYGVYDVADLADYMDEGVVTAKAVYDAEDEVVTYLVVFEK